MFKRNDKLILEVHINTNYTKIVVDRRSVIGHFTFFTGDLDIWRSKKQNVVVR